MSYQEVLSFWFSELKPEDWFIKNENLDKEILSRFSELHLSTSLGEMFSWRKSIEGRLAEILVLDQFSRNMFRNQARAFQYDSLSLILAQEASGLPDAKKMDPQRRAFLYMPYMHSESLKIHEVAMELFSEPGLEANLAYEIAHKNIIERFGRYPHRNAILGRPSSPEELEFLKLPGSSF